MSLRYRSLISTKANPFKDATVAYSLRDLNLGVTPNVVRVRRSSDNLEQDFTATQVTDGSLTTFCGAGDGFVKIWYDQTGVYDATQTTSTNQPKIVSAGALILEGGKPALDFDGVNDSLRNESFNVVQPFSFLSVTKMREAFSIIYDKSLTGTDRSYFYYESTSIIKLHSGVTIQINENFLNTRYQFTTIHNSVNSSINVNSTLKSSGNTGLNGLSSLSIGNQNNSSIPLDGNIQEIICINKDVTNDRENVETNINDHYNIY